MSMDFYYYLFTMIKPWCIQLYRLYYGEKIEPGRGKKPWVSVCYLEEPQGVWPMSWSLLSLFGYPYGMRLVEHYQFLSKDPENPTQEALDNNPYLSPSNNLFQVYQSSLAIFKENNKRLQTKTALLIYCQTEDPAVAPHPNNIYYFRVIPAQNTTQQTPTFHPIYYKLHVFPYFRENVKTEISFLSVEYSHPLLKGGPLPIDLSKFNLSIGSEILDTLFLKRYFEYTFGRRYPFYEDGYCLTVMDHKFHVFQLNCHQYIMLMRKMYIVKSFRQGRNELPKEIVTTSEEGNNNLQTSPFERQTA